MSDARHPLDESVNVLYSFIEQTGTENSLAGEIGKFRNTFAHTAPADRSRDAQLLFAKLPMIEKGHCAESLKLLKALHADAADELSHTKRCRLETSIAHHLIISCDFDAAAGILNAGAFPGCPFRLLFLGYLYLMKSQQGDSSLSLLCEAEKYLLRSAARFRTLPAAPDICVGCLDKTPSTFHDTAALYIALAGLWRQSPSAETHFAGLLDSTYRPARLFAPLGMDLARHDGVFTAIESSLIIGFHIYRFPELLRLLAEWLAAHPSPDIELVKWCEQKLFTMISSLAGDDDTEQRLRHTGLVASLARARLRLLMHCDTGSQSDLITRILYSIDKAALQECRYRKPSDLQQNKPGAGKLLQMLAAAPHTGLFALAAFDTHMGGKVCAMTETVFGEFDTPEAARELVHRANEDGEISTLLLLGDRSTLTESDTVEQLALRHPQTRILCSENMERLGLKFPQLIFPAAAAHRLDLLKFEPSAETQILLPPLNCSFVDTIDSMGVHDLQDGQDSTGSLLLIIGHGTPSCIDLGNRTLRNPEDLPQSHRYAAVILFACDAGGHAGKATAGSLRNLPIRILDACPHILRVYAPVHPIPNDRVKNAALLRQLLDAATHKSSLLPIGWRCYV